MRIPIVALLFLGIGSANVQADSQRPSAVTNIQASAISGSSIRINWSAPWDDVGVDGYNIYRNNRYFKTVFNTTNYIDQDVSANSHYEYTIVAFDRARNYSLMSSGSSASTGGSSGTSSSGSSNNSSSTSSSSSTQQAAAPSSNGTPAAPTTLQAEPQEANSLKLSWRAPGGTISGYNVYRDGGYYTTVKGRTDYTALSLSQGREYRWRVVAFSGNKYSVKSSEIVASTSSGSSASSSSSSSSSTSSPPPPVTATTAAPPPQENSSSNIPGGYRQVFSEEFKSRSLSSSRWQSRYRWGSSRTINNEQQFYIDSLNYPSFGHSPFEFDGEHLIISATRTPSNLRGKANNKEYLSGALTTYGKFKMRYGYVEMRARLPKGKGLWPAFWLLHNQESGKRPEIDVVEMLGDNTNKIYQTYHYYDNWSLRSTPSYQYGGSDFSQDFHTFGMKWEPGRITWYVDGKATNSYSNSSVSSEDMYLLVNLAVGGSWPGSPDGRTSFPARLTIDYIRAYSPS